MSYEVTSESLVIDQLRALAGELLTVEEIRVLAGGPRPLVELAGHLVNAQEDEAFERLVAQLEPLGYTPLLFRREDLVVLQAVPQVADKKTGKPWVNLVLFILTLLSVLFIGAANENIDLLAHPEQLLLGVPFAATLLGILTAHELSHYFVGRRYGSPVSLPYFIPLPLSLFGTMGAVILQRAPMRSRKALFDIGVAGPLGGLIVAVPLLFFGLSGTLVGKAAEFMGDLPAGSLISEGNSLLYLFAKLVMFGRILPDAAGNDVWLSSPSPTGAVAFAAWAGLLVTALNLFPIGQLDGGHIAYALWGRKAWTLARLFVGLAFGWGAILLLLGNGAGWTWLLWAFLGQLMGPRHPAPLNDLTPLDPRRRLLGWLMVVIFILVLVPIPIMITNP